MARRAVLAGLLALAAWCAHAQEELGTLFYTPAQREQLDHLRRGESVEPAAASEAGRRHSVTGYVERSDGRGVVWIDGKPVVVRDPADRRIFDPSEVRAYSRSADEVRIERKR
ncbi:MAG TPA: hypothetical protein VN782_05075 [Usitatibacter sp.]|nr:hypothetical protein [Usitatibacter sp.]